MLPNVLAKTAPEKDLGCLGPYFNGQCAQNVLAKTAPEKDLGCLGRDGRPDCVCCTVILSFIATRAPT